MVCLSLKSALLGIYDVHYKKLMVLSFLILLVSIASLFVVYARTGEFFAKDVSLKGGITMTVPVDHPVDIQELEAFLKAGHPSADINVREITKSGKSEAIIVEAADVTSADLEKSLPEFGIALNEGEYSLESMGSSLGKRFFTQIMKALILAFIAMAIVVFLTFRSIVPSLFIVLSAISDIVSTLAVSSILGMRLSTAGIAALLMLIGYSVDTNILLTTKVLKRKSEGGTVFERTVGGLRTGLTMTGTALVAGIIGLYFTQSEMIRDIMLITVIGLVFDVIYTWFQNAGILRWYLERKDGRN